MKEGRGLTRALSWVPSLYFAEGLPYALVMTVAVILYKCLEIDNTRIALYTAWLYLPWVIKPLWSPIVDIFGTKRRWILLMQWGIALAIAGVALTLRVPGFFAWSLAMFWLMAFLSATHDIAADGFYMLALPSREQSMLVGLRTLFYRLAMIAGQGGVVVAAGYLSRTQPQAVAWQWALSGVATLFVIIAAWHTFILPRPKADHREDEDKSLSVKSIMGEFAETIRTFFVKPHLLSALLFMLLYRFPEAQLVKLIGPFLLDSRERGGLAMATERVGVTYGTIGVIALIVGGIIGGWLVSVKGLRKCMMPMAWSMSLTCATFLFLSFFPDTPAWVVDICVGVEQFGYGFGTTAYTLYLIHFSTGKSRTSHYAICTGLMALGMMLPGMWSGWLQEHLGYQLFFIYTMICCVVTIAVSLAVKRHISVNTTN